MAKLVVLSEGYTGRTYELKVDKTTVGRLEDNTFQILEPSVSSHHCEVMLRGHDIVVKDLNSTNGTFINGEKITEAVLKPGQILRLGTIELRLETGGAPAAAAAAAAAGKKPPLDQTRVIPQGVKLNDLELGTQPVKFEADSPFAKKTNKANIVFITVGVVLGVIIIVAIVFAFISLRT